MQIQYLWPPCSLCRGGTPSSCRIKATWPTPSIRIPAPMLPRTPQEHALGSRIPKGKKKPSQNPAQDQGQAGKSDLSASHHVFPQWKADSLQQACAGSDSSRWLGTCLDSECLVWRAGPWEAMGQGSPGHCPGKHPNSASGAPREAGCFSYSVAQTPIVWPSTHWGRSREVLRLQGGIKP